MHGQRLENHPEEYGLVGSTGHALSADRLLYLGQAQVERPAVSCRLSTAWSSRALAKRQRPLLRTAVAVFGALQTRVTSSRSSRSLKWSEGYWAVTFATGKSMLPVPPPVSTRILASSKFPPIAKPEFAHALK